MAEPKRRAITTGGADYVPRAAALHGESFKDDPVMNFILNTLPVGERRDYLPTWMGQLVTAGSLNSGIFDEIDDFSCSALWLPPGRSIDNLRTYWKAGLHRMLYRIGFVGVKHMMWDYEGQTASAKKEGLYSRGWTEFYYLFLLSTREGCRGRGMGAALVERCKERAREEGVPIWLEATTEGSMRLYKRLGFDLSKEITLGKGEADLSGNRERGGAGVKLWAMIWEPHPFKAGRGPSDL